jgi:putative spermidine/putrescine transport system permease protein
MAALSISPLILFLIVASIFPIVFFLSQGFRSGSGQFSLQELWGAFLQPAYMRVIWNSIKTSFYVVILVLFLGYPVAYTIHKARGAFRVFLLLCTLLPFFTSVLVRTYAWSIVLGLHGPINNMLIAVGILDRPVLLGHSAAGIWIGLTQILLPTAILSMLTIMSRIDEELVVVSQSLGASSLRSFWGVFFPLSIPGIVLGGLLTFILALGAYIIPAALGGVRDVMFGQVLVMVATVMLNWPLAAALTLIFLVSLAIPLTLLMRGGRFSDLTGGGRAETKRTLSGLIISPRLRAAARPTSDALQLLAAHVARLLDLVPAPVSFATRALLAFLTLAFLLIPEVIVVILSFGNPRYLNWPPETLTFDGYLQFVGDPVWVNSLLTSLECGLLSMVLSLVLGSVAAYGLVRGQFRHKGVIVALALLPLAMPEIALAISYYAFVSSFGLSGTIVAIVVGQTVTGCGLVLLVISAVLRSLNVEIEYAARASGATPQRTFIDIVVPITWPSFVIAALYSFLNSFDNLLVPLFVGGANQTLPVRMWLQMISSTSPMITVVASLMIFGVILIGCFASAIQSAQRRRIAH